MSFNNQCLIHLQRPDAKYIAPFKTFSDMGYFPKKGEKSIKVLVPSFLTFVKVMQQDNTFEVKPLFTLTKDERKRYYDKNDPTIIYYDKILKGYNIGSVFDASQTTMPLNIIEEELNPNLTNPDADETIEIFIKVIYTSNLKIKFENLNGTTKGYCDFDNNTIVIKKGLGNLMQLKVMIHEYAHALAHQHLKNNNLEYRKNRERYESEAEAIAYVVTKFLNMDTSNYSLTYLYSWSKNKDFQELDDSFKTIVNYSTKIINNYNRLFDENYGLYAEEYKSLKI